MEIFNLNAFSVSQSGSGAEAGGAAPLAAAGPIGARADTIFLQVIADSLDDAKAEEITVLDITGKTSLADAMAIATGRSNTHVGAIAERVVRAIKDAGRPAPRLEGQPQNDWVLVDAGDVIIHIFRPEVRQFYNLEKMWGADRPDEKRLR